MNKKISFLILSTYLTTSIVPTSVFAQENTNELLNSNSIQAESDHTAVENGEPNKEGQQPSGPTDQDSSGPTDQDSSGPTDQDSSKPTDQDSSEQTQNQETPSGPTEQQPSGPTEQPGEQNQEQPGEETQKPDEIKLSKITVKYVNLKGEKIHKTDTNETLVQGNNNSHTELFIKPATINNKCATKVKVNGTEYSYISGIFLALDKDHEEINIEWIYEDGMPSIMHTASSTLIHKTFFPEDKSTIDGNNKYVFPMNHRYNISMSSDNVEFFYSSLKNNVVELGHVNTTNNFNENNHWLTNIVKNNKVLDINRFTVKSSHKQPSSMDVQVSLTKDECKEYFSQSNTNTIYTYKIDEKNKKLIPSGKLNIVDNSIKDKDNAYVLFNGKVNNAINSDILYSTVEIDVNSNKPSQDSTVENDKDNTGNKDENLNEGMHKGPFGIANTKGLGTFTVTYNQYLEELKKLNDLGNNNLEESFLPINGTNGLDFYLHLSFKNLEDVFKTVKNTSDIKINLTENINGSAKKFNDLYKAKIIQTVTIESNMLHSFKANNNINVKNNGHIYLVPNTNAGKVVYLGEQTNTTKISTKADLDNMTIFVTSEKITLNEDGTLPDTSGVGPIVMVGGVVLTLAGGFIVLGKRKKEHK